MQIGGTLDLISVSIKYSVHDDLKVIRVSNHIVSIFDQGCEWESLSVSGTRTNPKVYVAGGKKHWAIIVIEAQERWAVASCTFSPRRQSDWYFGHGLLPQYGVQ